MMPPFAIVLLVALTAAAVIASLHAWRMRQSYGAFRFVGFESLIVLVAWNTGRWFREPFSVRQMVSWCLLVTATALAAHGARLLRVAGQAHERIIEDTQAVVTVGVYRYVRHPLYASLILFGWGVVFKGLDLLSFILALVATGFLVATARSEERFNVQRFGSAYADYMSSSKMFIPFVF